MTRFSIDPVTLDFDLPEELIAQEPLTRRDQARLLVLHKSDGRIEHRVFSELADYLKAGDVLVINAARVNQSKLIGKKPSGGKVEVILLQPEANGLWRSLARPLLKDGTEILFSGAARAVVAGRTPNGEYLLRWEAGDPAQLMESGGRVPLPPYIKRETDDPRHAMDRELYQTVYAAKPGSVAAPTAGLHFTDELLQRLSTKGVEIVKIVLHVGWGTFRPIANRVEDHRMLGESYELEAASIAAIAGAQKEKRRIIAVGTTSTRVLESLPEKLEEKPYTGETELFIRPGYGFRRVSALVTNFHVPRSTPVSLTAAFSGMPRLENAYEQAIEKKYRFFSYGDAMLVIE